MTILLLVPIVRPAQSIEGGATRSIQSDPPFSGTIFIDPDIVTELDPSTFESVAYAGQGSRTMFDRRVNNWITVNAYLFNADFDDGLDAEIQVNPEFGSSDAALVEAQKYGWLIGQLPNVLRRDVETVWIHKGTQPFGGGNNNLLIHTGQSDEYMANGIIEETLVHEASHTSLDAAHASASGWLSAATADDEFISTYARDYPDREDVAESFLPYLAIRYRSGRISDALENTIVQTIPNRIAYFDDQSFNMYPIEATGVSAEQSGESIPEEFALLQNYPNPFNPVTSISFHLPHSSRISLKVFDLMGREIAEPASGQYPAGIFQAQWNATLVPSGVYVYRLIAGGTSRARAMILQK